VEGGRVSRAHWFLPETPDVLGQLRRQTALAIDGVRAFAAWAGGDAAAAQALRDACAAGDVAKRELLGALQVAFVTPLEPEDVFALSRAIDRILSEARGVVSESEAMACPPPDDGLAQMAALLGDGLAQLDAAIARLGSDGAAATAAADAAIASERALSDAYYRGMAALLAVEDRSERVSRRELYRRCARIGETLVDAAERVVYAVVKQS
jgi:uncharacterized protein